MNKSCVVISLAAAAAIAGCIDPNYKRPDVKLTPVPVNVEQKAEVEEQTGEAKTEQKVEEVKVVPVEETVEPKEEVAPVEAAPAEPEYTVYIVQRGDYLAKISKKYNIKMQSIKDLNGLKNDRIRIGQKLKLPGKIEVGEQKEPEVKPQTTAKKPSQFAPYEGPVKEYVVKSGDTLGHIAYANGINIRQLKALNKLTSDGIRVGQKLQIPAEKVVKTASKAEVKSVKAEPVKVEEPVKVADEEAPVADALAEPVAPVVDDSTVQEPLPQDAAEPVAETMETYVVKEGDDVMSIAVRFSTSSSAIRELNNLGDDDNLTVGSIIKLPPDAAEGK